MPGQSATDDNPDLADRGAAPRRRPTRDDAREMIRRHDSNVESLVLSLMADRARATRRKQVAEARVAELEKTAKAAPAEGSVVLTGDEATAYTALTKDGAATLKDVVAELPQLRESAVKLAERSWDDAVREAAEALGLNARVLGDRLKADGLELNVTVTEQDGKRVKKYGAKKAGDAAAKVAAIDEAFISDNWADYAVALKAPSRRDGDTTRNGSEPRRTPFTPQPPARGGDRAGNNSSADTVGKYMASVYASPSELAERNKTT